MRKSLAGVLAALLVAGCGPAALKTHIKVGDVALGKVVVYRNGVAFYERRAQVRNGKLTVSVPRDRVDDFLKSLTVVDARTQTPLPVAFPRTQSESGAYIDMVLDVKVPDGEYADVKLTYVTESSAWKPSYRLVVGTGGKVMLEGWAVVDNLSGEDWNHVRVGVGSSAAMSFRYDLWSVRTVERESLAADEQFAVAPPTGVSPYGGSAGTAEGAGQALVTLEDAEIRRPAGHPGDAYGTGFSGSSDLENQYTQDGIDILAGRDQPTATTGVIRGRVTDAQSGMGLAGVTVVATSAAMQGAQTAITEETGSYAISTLPPGSYLVSYYYLDLTIERKGIAVGVNKATPVFQKLDTSRIGGETIMIESNAPAVDQSSTSQSQTIGGWDHVNNRPLPKRSYEAIVASGSAAGSTSDSTGATFDPVPPPPSRVATADKKIAALVPDLVKQRRHVVVEGYAAVGEPDPQARSADRANVVRNQMIDAGMPPARVRAVGKGAVPGHGPGVQLLTEAPQADGGAQRSAARPVDTSDAPVGESHFLSGVPMDVRRGTSAMVSVLREKTTGEEVYLYDAESERGDPRYAFRSVRLINPTEFTLEAGPVTVYGKDRYIGEGLTEPVPPKAPVVIPFALDRQVVVDRDHSTSDEVSRLMTLQRGVLTAEVQHLRRTKLTFTSRLHVPTRVYVRHTTQKGWQLRDPELPAERVGDAHLYELALPAGATRTVELVETTPLTRTLDLAAPATLDMMTVFVESPYPDDALESQLREVLAVHRDLIDGKSRIEGLREHLIEYRERSAELTDQLEALKKVKTATSLSRHLADKLKEVSDRIQATTIDIVDEQEKLMLSRVRFQDALAELTLPDMAVVARP